MRRPSREQTNMTIAHVIAERATCGRAKVGCVITQNHRVVSSGYNGPLGGHHCDKLGCDLEHKCQYSVHAEANAIAAAAREGIRLNKATLYCTFAPCKDCARLIVQSGIKEVYYLKNYTTPNNEGLTLLIENKVKIIQMENIWD